MDPYKKKRLYIRNMTQAGCIETIYKEALNAGLSVKSVKLGKITLDNKMTEEQLSFFTQGIERNGFKLITDKFIRLTETIKIEIIKIIQHEKKIPGNRNYAAHLSSKLGKEYNYMNGLFLRVEKTTIEKFILQQKVEKAKYLLTKGDLTLKEIASKLGFSNTQHLSAQFKKICGLSPYQFRDQHK